MEDASFTRALWLVLVPTAFAACPWIILGNADSPSLAVELVVAFLPLVGLPGVLVYRRLSSGEVQLRPYIAVLLLALVFAAAMTDYALASESDPDGAFIPGWPLLSGLLLPFVALGCGLHSHTPRRGDWPRTRL